MESGGGKSDAEVLLAEFLPFAEMMLAEHGEFSPFGGRMTLHGEIVWEGASNGRDRPLSQDLIALLRNEHRDLAERGLIKASAILYDVRITPPGCTSKQDAIAVELDHEGGYSAIVYYPYRLDSAAELHVGPPFAHKGANSTFADVSPNIKLQRSRGAASESADG
jgi:hypothetical protein